MADSKNKMLHKRSVEKGKVPSGSTLEYGEIAINYNAEAPFLSIKDSNNNYRKFIDETTIDEKLSDSLTTEITYDELVALRDGGELIPGMQYRITDYVTTTAYFDTQSAGHQFDIIVTADDASTLNEVARAIQHDGDTYFTDSDLNAWQIWYCLDNDVKRFSWADTENGKGVIYRMIDEWNNDLPYDFKNIQFKRNLIFENGYAEYSDAGGETWVYTFAGQSYHINNDEWSEMLDGSLESPFGHMSDENTSTFHDNTIKPYIIVYNGNDIYTECGLRYLNDIVFLGYWEKIGSANEEDIPYYYAYCCYSNSFGNSCTHNTFGNSCAHNTFGNDCYSNSFGISCHSNTFGNSCTHNTFGNSCAHNTFGNDCHSNTFGNSCYSNSFGNVCYSNTFGNDYYSNTFGIYCYRNNFGSNCRNNSFGNDCNNNSFGDVCSYNSFGSGCSNNSFRVSRDASASLKYSVYYTHFGDGCSYNVIWTDDSTSSNSTLKNINVNRGVCGTSSSYNFININTLNQDYEIQVYKDEGGNICIDTFPVPLTTNDIDLIWAQYFGGGGYGSGSASAIAAEEIINSIGVGDYDETEQ